jgi:hypothetical protein
MGPFGSVGLVITPLFPCAVTDKRWCSSRARLVGLRVGLGDELVDHTGDLRGRR